MANTTWKKDWPPLCYGCNFVITPPAVALQVVPKSQVQYMAPQLGKCPIFIFLISVAYSDLLGEIISLHIHEFAYYVESAYIRKLVYIYAYSLGRSQMWYDDWFVFLNHEQIMITVETNHHIVEKLVEDVNQSWNNSVMKGIHVIFRSTAIIIERGLLWLYYYMKKITLLTENCQEM